MGIFTHPPGGAESGLPNPVTLATGIANPRRNVHFWGWGMDPPPPVRTKFTHPLGGRSPSRKHDGGIPSPLRRGFGIPVAD